MRAAVRPFVLSVPTALALVTVLSVVTLRAGAPSQQDTAAPRLLQYGVVNLRAVQPPAPGSRGRRLAPFRPVDPAAFRRRKNAARGGGLVATSQAPAPTSPSLTLSDAGFDGMSLADGGAIPPDTQIGVSSQYIFEAVNDHVRIWSRTSPPTL